MAARLPDGSIVSISTTYGTAKTISAITNANPGVATSTAHGLTNGTYGELVSGWANLNNRVVRLANQVTNAFDLEGIDTSSTTLYPAASGAGSFTPITGWQQISQIMGLTTSGGDQEFTDYSFLEQNFKTQIPTTTSAQSIKLEIADDPSLAGYIALKAASDARAVRTLRLQLPDGSLILYRGYVSFNETPTLDKGALMKVSASFSLLARPVRYAS